MKYFRFDEFTHSATADLMNIDNTPKDFDVVENIICLAYFLDDIRDELNEPIIVNSGYRSKELNTYLNGAKHSLHMQRTCSRHTQQEHV